MKLYYIPVGTIAARLKGDYGLYGLTPAWYEFTTGKPVFYNEMDIVTHGSADVSWVFKLPKSASPWTHLSVSARHVRLLSV